MYPSLFLIKIKPITLSLSLNIKWLNSGLNTGFNTCI